GRSRGRRAGSSLRPSRGRRRSPSSSVWPPLRGDGSQATGTAGNGRFHSQLFLRPTDRAELTAARECTKERPAGRAANPPESLIESRPRPAVGRPSQAVKLARATAAVRPRRRGLESEFGRGLGDWHGFHWIFICNANRSAIRCPLRGSKGG